MTRPCIVALPIALLLAASAGCDEDGAGQLPDEQAARAYQGSRGGPPARPENAQSAQSMPARTKVLPSPLGSLLPGGGGGGGGAGYPGQPRGRVMNEQEAQEAARAVAASTPEGNTPCAQAFNALRDIQAAYREATPSAKRRGRSGLANRARFMEGCLAKPPEMQQCMVPSYLRGHSEECERVVRQYGRDMEMPAGWEEAAPAGGGQARASSEIERERQIEEGQRSASDFMDEDEEMILDEDE